MLGARDRSVKGRDCHTHVKIHNTQHVRRQHRAL